VCVRVCVCVCVGSVAFGTLKKKKEQEKSDTSGVLVVQRVEEIL